MNEELKQKARETSNKIWNTGGKLTHNEIDELIFTLLDQAKKSERERMAKEIQETKFADLIRFYQSNRGSGHTYATVKGVENTDRAFLLVVNEQQKQNTGLPNDKQISLNGKEMILGGRRFAVVPDNYTLQEMFKEIITILTKDK